MRINSFPREKEVNGLSNAKRGSLTFCEMIDYSTFQDHCVLSRIVEKILLNRISPNETFSDRCTSGKLFENTENVVQ